MTSQSAIRVFGDIEVASLLSTHFSTLTLGVTAEKGSVDEPAALAAMETLIRNLTEHGIRCVPLLRNTPEGDRPDGVRISF